MTALSLGCRFALGLTLAAAGVSKLSERQQFSDAVANYKLVPQRFVNGVAVRLPFVEAGLGLLLVLGILTRPAAIAVAGLLASFVGAVSINLVRGRVINCACFSVTLPRKISWGTVLRNMLLMGAATLLVVDPPTTWALNSTLSRGGHISSEAALLVLMTSTLLAVSAALVFESVHLIRLVRQHRLEVEGRQV